MAGSEASVTGALWRDTASTSSSLSDVPSTITVSIAAYPPCPVPRWRSAFRHITLGDSDLRTDRQSPRGVNQPEIRGHAPALHAGTGGDCRVGWSARSTAQ